MGAVAKVESTQPRVLADKNQISHHGLTASVCLTENRSAESKNWTPHVLNTFIVEQQTTLYVVPSALDLKKWYILLYFFAIMLLPPFLRVCNVSVLSFSVETCWFLIWIVSHVVGLYFLSAAVRSNIVPLLRSCSWQLALLFFILLCLEWTFYHCVSFSRNIVESYLLLSGWEIIACVSRTGPSARNSVCASVCVCFCSYPSVYGLVLI